MKIATWNVNSLNVRLPHVLEWLASAEPDVLVLQEIKQVTEAFSEESFKEAGYQSIASGQKTYNGVAVISRNSSADHVTDFPGFEDPPAKFAHGHRDLPISPHPAHRLRPRRPVAPIPDRARRRDL